MDKAERRVELLRAARDVFATKGYHDAKVDDITASAKVAKGTFYLYFQDKRSVFAELVDGLFAKLGAAIIHVDVSGDVEEQVLRNVRGIVDVFLDDRALTRILLSFAAGLDPAFVAKVHSFYGGVKALLQASLEEGQSLGIVAPGDAKMYATFSIGALKEMLAEAVHGDAVVDRDAFVRGLFGLLQGGYLRVATEAAVKKGAAKKAGSARGARAQRA